MSFVAGQRVTAAQLNAVQIIPAAPTTTLSNGTSTSGATDTRDDVLGVYQWTAVSGLRYRAVLSNMNLSGTVVGDLYRVTIRYRGDATTPATTDTAVAVWQKYMNATAGPGQETVEPTGTFLATASGTNTIAVFTARLAGTGVGTPVSAIARELYVELVGSV